MKEYFSHLTAALKWNIPTLDILFGVEDVDKRRNKQIIDITFVDPIKRYKKEEYKSHSCKMLLPRGAVVKSGKGYWASPELVFLELAKELDMQRLILLGLQMCWHPVGKASKAITTKRKLKAFLEKSSRFDGLLKAERAVRYIEDGSASIMESILFMILTLPYKLGGYGFGGVEFNHEIPLDSKARKQLGQERCYVDLYYEKSKLAIEYDSYEHHNDPKSHSKDSVRASALKRHGIDVIQIYTYQFFNQPAFEDVIVDLASRLRKRLRNNVPGFHEAHMGLRELLPSKEQNSVSLGRNSAPIILP